MICMHGQEEGDKALGLLDEKEESNACEEATMPSEKKGRSDEVIKVS